MNITIESERIGVALRAAAPFMLKPLDPPRALSETLDEVRLDPGSAGVSNLPPLFDACP